MSCCQNDLYNNNFDRKRAQEELENYRKTGPKTNSLPLINIIKKLELKDSSLLDIGSGVGSVIFELFEEGIQHATYNDFSTGYSEAFREEARKRNIYNQIDFYLGDFLEIQQKIQSADLVSLDKAICCYRNYEDLVNYSVRKAKKWYAYSVPRDVWWVKVVHWGEQKIRWIKGNPFRSYIHPTDKIEAIVTQNGFKKIHNHFNREWQTAVFERIAI